MTSVASTLVLRKGYALVINLTSMQRDHESIEAVNVNLSDEDFTYLKQCIDHAKWTQCDVHESISSNLVVDLSL